MIKVIHLADLHLGIDRYGSINPETGLSLQVEDFLKAFDEVIDYAINWGADIFLFCGDTYKSRDPSQTQQREFARRIARLVNNNIAVFLLVGNHDLPNARGLANSLEIFQTLGVGNVTVASSAGTYKVETGQGPVQIVALPWATRAALLTREDFKNNTIETLNRVIEGKITDILQVETESLDPDLPSILAGHLTHSMAVVGSERGLYLSHDYVLPASVLSNPAFDYVALGHIHKTQKIELPVPVVYAGSLQRMDFGEEDQEKGFYTLEIDPVGKRGERLKSYNFVPVNARRFLTIDVKVGPDDLDPTSTVIRHIVKQGEAVKDAVVRLRIHLHSDTPGAIRDTEIRHALREARHIAAISREVETRSRPRLGGISAEGLSPISALGEYMKLVNMEPDRRKVLTEYAEKLINECTEG
ncbi:MAG: exonuclease SbcCD subunit D [Dehalococcoidia bacterium]|nr:exonuclease SbcCD subunit D [Dehalococcoidia bacterium]